MKQYLFSLATTVLLVLVTGMSDLLAEVGDPTLRTDHKVYAGEGAFQTVEDCVAFATADAHGPQEKAIALYLWLLQHQYHEASPQQWLVSNHVPDTLTPREELTPYDANVARFSFGYGLCGTVHAWNEPYWHVLGFDARRRAFPGHTNSEVKYGGSWHAFDTDMAGLVFCEDGTVAGYEEIANSPDLVKHARPPLPCYPFAWPSDFETMKQGWNQIAKQGESKFYRMYATGYAAEPGIVQLRSGERFTRRFDRDAYGGISKRRFWHAEKSAKGGPSRNWTFVNTEKVEHATKLDRNKAMGNASYCNAEFDYVPDLSQRSCLEGMSAMSENLVASGTPRLKSKDGRPAYATFFHRSPYVIAGDPVDDKNSMTGEATDGFVVTGSARGMLGVEVSADGGQTWVFTDSVSGNFRLDLTEIVKGRFRWDVRFSMKEENGLDAVRFMTTCQMNEAMYPRLTPSGSTVSYRCRSRGVVAIKPQLVNDSSLATVELGEMRSSNLEFVGHSQSSGKAYQTSNNKPAHVVFKVASPQKLLQVNAAVKLALRVPMPEGSDFRLEVSTDQGQTWMEMAEADIPLDNDYSNAWLSGSADVSGDNVNSALVRAHLYLGGYSTGIFDFEAYGIHETSPPGPVKIIYAWTEDGHEKTFERKLSTGTDTAEFIVPTGNQIVDKFVTIVAE